MIAALTSATSVAQIMGSKADWNIKSEPSPLLNDRQLELHRGRYDITSYPNSCKELFPADTI